MKALRLLVGLYFLNTGTSFGCAAVSGSSVVNGDQNVVIVWDAKKRTQHFIRQASFKSAAADVGFIVPSPTAPELEEAGDAAFTLLEKMTRPAPKGGIAFPIGCSATTKEAAPASVEVLQEKKVAGFDAVVLRAGSSASLIDWLSRNGYSYSKELADWAEPYIAKDWPFTALKVSKDKASQSSQLAAAALRISFKTDVPLFPYREPDSAAAAKKLGAARRMLRIYFVGDQAYGGAFEKGQVWSGRNVWSESIESVQHDVFRALKLPAGSGPEKAWLTVFEDRWPYEKAPGDVVFSPGRQEAAARKKAGVGPIDPLLVMLGGWVLFRVFRGRFSGEKSSRSAAQ